MHVYVKFSVSFDVNYQMTDVILRCVTDKRQLVREDLFTETHRPWFFGIFERDSLRLNLLYESGKREERGRNVRENLAHKSRNEQGCGFFLFSLSLSLSLTDGQDEEVRGQTRVSTPIHIPTGSHKRLSASEQTRIFLSDLCAGTGLSILYTLSSLQIYRR